MESIVGVYFVVLMVDVWLELSVVLLVFNVRDIVLNVILKIVSRMIVGIMEYILVMFFIIGVGWMNEFDKNGLKFFEEKMFLNLV